jgi:hypothetical protein
MQPDIRKNYHREMSASRERNLQLVAFDACPADIDA